jgi:tight adherence protein C
MTGSMSGAVLGAIFALSVLLLVSRLRATAPLTLRARIAPFVPHLRTDDRESRASTVATLREILTTARPSRIGAGGSMRVNGLEQVVAIGVGVGVGALLGFVLALRGSSGLLVILLAALGGVAAQLSLSATHARAAKLRALRISAELPDLAELLAFAVAAGESPAAALARVGAMSRGDLGILMQRASADTRLGTTFEVAMRDLVHSSGCSDVERFVDALLLAMERGTPLADLLRAQAADSRAAQARRLMESAGRKDVSMLIPVVFLILPTVVLIALFPGFRSLHLFVN